MSTYIEELAVRRGEYLERISKIANGNEHSTATSAIFAILDILDEYEEEGFND